MNGYDALNSALQANSQPPTSPIWETMQPEQFEDPLSPVPLLAEHLSVQDLETLPGMMDWLDLETPHDMGSEQGPDQLALHLYMMTLAFKEALRRLAAVEGELLELRGR